MDLYLGLVSILGFGKTQLAFSADEFSLDPLVKVKAAEQPDSVFPFLSVPVLKQVLYCRLLRKCAPSLLDNKTSCS